VFRGGEKGLYSHFDRGLTKRKKVVLPHLCLTEKTRRKERRGDVGTASFVSSPVTFEGIKKGKKEKKGERRHSISLSPSDVAGD